MFTLKITFSNTGHQYSVYEKLPSFFVFIMIRWIDNIVLLDNHVESNGEIYLYCSFETSRRHSVKYICKRVRLGECQAYKGCACASRCGLTALQHYLLCYFVTLCLFSFRFCSNETFPPLVSRL